jgi:hypothetical protein
MLRLQIQRIQEAVDRMLQDGPDARWQPSHARGTFVDTVATLGKLGHGDMPGAAWIRGQLAQLTVATICIAVKYRVPLQQAFNEASLSPDLTEQNAWSTDPECLPALAMSLPALAEPVIATITHYDEGNGQGSGSGASQASAAEGGRQSLYALLPGFLMSVFSGFGSADELRQSIWQQLRAGSGPGAGGAPDFDASTARSLDFFAAITQRTFCPFAGKSRLWGAPDYDATRPFAQNMQASLPSLRAFVRVLPTDGLDGYVYAFPVSVFGGSVTGLARLFRAVLGFLTGQSGDQATDPGGPAAPKLAPSEVLQPSWRLFILGEQFFASVFAPFYRSGHSRHTYESRDWIFIMLQPESAIHQYIPHDAFDARSQGIRERYAESFQSYDLAEFEADRFLLPLNPGDEPVRWYDFDCTDPLQPGG